MEEDWLMRQIKLAGEGIGVILKKQVASKDLGEIVREDGTKIARYDLVLEYLNAKKFNEAFRLINSLKFTMSYYDFECISNWYINLLYQYKENGNEKLLLDSDIERYKTKLKELM